MISKNIVICADGTGNRGGTTPDSNVYRIYQALDLQSGARAKKPPQISFYDNGVGTSTNKYWKAITGAVGIGFRVNVLEMYRYLSRHYAPGDKIFLFGFSRGAAEVRALNGMIAAVGLVNGSELEDEELDRRVHDAFTSYRLDSTEKEVQSNNQNFGVIPIWFIGVWDTVSALGFPQKWPEGPWLLPFYKILSGSFTVLGRIVDHIPMWAHRFYNDALTSNVERAYHALALDDQRLSFSPVVWDETTESAKNVKVIEQVWFPGMHSNVGGGYGRTELSYVALRWMLEKAISADLRVCQGFEQLVEEKANPLGLMHDSRDGLALFYRYTPRNVQALSRCTRQPAKVHQSALRRMQYKSQNYAPDILPREIQVVVPKGAQSSGSQRIANEKLALDEAVFQPYDDQIKRIQGRRVFLYTVFLESIIALLVAVMVAWSSGLRSGIVKCVSWVQDLPGGGGALAAVRILKDMVRGLSDWIQPVTSILFEPFAGIVNFLTPAFVEPFIEAILIRWPILGVGLIVYIWLLSRLKNTFREQGARVSSRLRNEWIKSIRKSKSRRRSRSRRGSAPSGQSGRRLDKASPSTNRGNASRRQSPSGES